MTDHKDCKLCQFFANPKRGHEGFQMLTLYWDVDAGYELARDREVHQAPLYPNLARLVEWPPDPVDIDLFKVHVDEGHLDHVDMTRPILVSHVPSGLGLTGDDMARPKVIDGHHRIARAIRDGLETVPYVMLTEAESDLICTYWGVSIPQARKDKVREDRRKAAAAGRKQASSTPPRTGKRASRKKNQ